MAELADADEEPVSTIPLEPYVSEGVRKAQGMLKPRGMVGKAYGASIMGERADLKLVREEIGVRPDLKAIAHGDFHCCHGSSCLGVCRPAGGVEA